MFILKILVQHTIYKLNKIFYYLSDNEVKVGSRVAINFNNQEIIGFVDEVELFKEGSTLFEATKDYNFKKISSVIDEEPIINDELLQLARRLSEYYFYPLIGVLQAMLPPSLKPKNTLYKAPKIKYATYYEIHKEKIADFSLSSNELKCIKKFDAKPILATKDVAKTKSLESLISKNIISIKTVEVNKYEAKITFNYEDQITLNEEQNYAFNTISNSDKTLFLLKGVTGSGKTEVYIKLIENTLKENKSTIVLVPEIALTPLMISRLLSYFKNGVAVLHSSLSPQEKYDEYRKIARGEARIVVGTRSAIFAPVNDLGLIIIDEEHDECYKEDNQGLLYNAKEVAIFRSKMNNAKVVLGSATPSIDTMAKAKLGKIELLELTKRYKEINLPNVQIVNKLDYKFYSPKSYVFSLPMIAKIKETLLKDEQAILLINSRGYSSYLMCRECGHVYKCPTCGLPLYYHKEDNILYCHHCEYKMKKPTHCPNCSSNKFTFGNFGIEKVEEDFKKIFKTDYLVLDSDRTPKTLQIERVLKDFNDKKANILIGTQIVSKGHDFKNVSFVGILNADTLLNFPNYRSREMTFNLIAQTIGRAGRKEGNGFAIIQTSAVNDYAILSASNQDYDAFYDKEIKERKMMKNPPFSSVCSIEISTSKLELTRSKSYDIKHFLESMDLENCTILGPNLMRKKYKNFYTQIFIKYKKLSSIKDTISTLIDIFATEQNVKVTINFNPYSF